MQLREIAQQIALPERTVRYILDHRLLPGQRGKVQANLAGQPISFTDLEALGLAAAAILFDGGLKRQAIIQCMAFLCDARCLHGEEFPHLLRARGGARRMPLHLIGSGPAQEKAMFWLGDGNHCRLQIDSFEGSWRAPPNWIRLDPAHCPRVVSQLDLGCLREQILRPSRISR